MSSESVLVTVLPENGVLQSRDSQLTQDDVSGKDKWLKILATKYSLQYILKHVCYKIIDVCETVPPTSLLPQLHMVGDGGIRGATLEACLAKIQHCSGEGTGNNPRHLKIYRNCLSPSFHSPSSSPIADIQLVGMSATLSNQKELAQFLRAEVYSSDFRPVSECMCVCESH